MQLDDPKEPKEPQAPSGGQSPKDSTPADKSQSPPTPSTSSTQPNQSRPFNPHPRPGQPRHQGQHASEGSPRHHGPPRPQVPRPVGAPHPQAINKPRDQQGTAPQGTQVRFFALGGMDEHGKNTYVFETTESIYVFDNGIAFPTNDLFGVSKIVIDTTYLVANKHKIKGIFLSQPSEWLNGGMFSLLQSGITTTVYGSALSEYALQQQMAKVPNAAKYEFVVLTANQRIKLHDAELLAFPVFSNTIGSFGYAMLVDGNAFVYVQDFIYSNDLNPAFTTDFAELQAFLHGQKVAMLAVGVNEVSAAGFTSPKHKVKPYLESALRDFADRAIVAVYQNDLFSILSVFSLARDLQRPVSVFSRATQARLEFLIKNGTVNARGLQFLEPAQLNETKSSIVIIAGSVDRLFFKISKIATGYDELLKLKDTDLFISLAPSVNGNEALEAQTLDDLARNDLKVVTRPRSVANPQAHAEDVKSLVNLLKPTYLVPMNGLYKDFCDMGRAAIETGFNKDNIKLLGNGEALVFTNGMLTKYDPQFLNLNEIYVESDGVSDIGAVVLAERKQMANDGVAIIAVGVDVQSKSIGTSLDVQIRGITLSDEHKPALERINRELTETIVQFGRLYQGKSFDLKELKHEVRKKAAKIIEKTLKKRPIILASVTELR